jgi:hypothetical protein
LLREGGRALTAPLLAVGLLLALGVSSDTRRLEVGCGTDVRLAHDWLEPSPTATVAAASSPPASSVSASSVSASDPSDRRSASGRGAGVPPELRGRTFLPDVDELHALQNRVVDDRAYWHDRGVNIRSVGVDITAGRITVGVVEPAGGVRRRLADRYGPAVRVTAPGPALCFSQAAMAPPPRRAMVVGAAGSPDRYDSS